MQNGIREVEYLTHKYCANCRSAVNSLRGGSEKLVEFLDRNLLDIGSYRCADTVEELHVGSLARYLRTGFLILEDILGKTLHCILRHICHAIL